MMLEMIPYIIGFMRGKKGFLGLDIFEFLLKSGFMIVQFSRFSRGRRLFIKHRYLSAEKTVCAEVANSSLCDVLITGHFVAE